MAHPFPLPPGPQCDWGAREHQQAANHFCYEVLAVDRSDPNYRPLLSLLESEQARHTRYARRLRAETGI